MKRYAFIIIVLALSLVSAGCAKKDETASSGDVAGTSETQATGAALPASMLLMVGTFRLEGTDQAVTADQAGELLPLWKAYRSLSGSDSVSTAEIEALEKQIRETMADDQVASIEAMRLDGEDLSDVMQEQGIETAMGRGASSLSEEAIATMQARRASGGGGFGGGPGGGPGGGRPDMGQAPDPEQIATLRAQHGSGGGPGLQSPLYDALIELLQSKL